VDDEADVRAILARYFRRKGHHCVEAASGLEALEILKQSRFDAILSDIQMPKMSGLELLRAIQREQIDAAIVMITANLETKDAVRAMKLGADDYILKPFQFEEVSLALDRALERKELKRQVRLYQDSLEDMVVQRTSQVNRMFLNVIQSLVYTLEAKDPYTDGHSRRVAWLAAQLGRAAGLADSDIRVIQIGGMFHDLGKIGIRESVLQKTGKLTAEEYAHIKTHPEVGVRILNPLEELRSSVPVVLHHHECFDGGGYPHGLEAEQIPIGARIVAVVDAFDAMTSDRPYRHALDSEQAIARLEGGIGRQFDPQLVGLFIPMARSAKFQQVLFSPAWTARGELASGSSVPSFADQCSDLRLEP